MPTTTEATWRSAPTGCSTSASATAARAAIRSGGPSTWRAARQDAAHRPATPSGDLGYTIPPDNPFVGTEGRRGEIWSIGLRNPWRYSFDPTPVTCGSPTSARAASRRSTSPRRPTASTPAAAATSGGAPSRAANRSTTTSPPRTIPLRSSSTTTVAVAARSGGGVRPRGDGAEALAGWYVFADYCTGEVMAISITAGKARRSPSAPNRPSRARQPGRIRVGGCIRPGRRRLRAPFGDTVYRLDPPDQTTAEPPKPSSQVQALWGTIPCGYRNDRCQGHDPRRRPTQLPHCWNSIALASTSRRPLGRQILSPGLTGPRAAGEDADRRSASPGHGGPRRRRRHRTDRRCDSPEHRLGEVVDGVVDTIAPFVRPPSPSAVRRRPPRRARAQRPRWRRPAPPRRRSGRRVAAASGGVGIRRRHRYVPWLHALGVGLVARPAGKPANGEQKGGAALISRRQRPLETGERHALRPMGSNALAVWRSRRTAPSETSGITLNKPVFAVWEASATARLVASDDPALRSSLSPVVEV